MTTLVDVIEKTKAKEGTILLAAERLSDLPVTVVVNLGIQISRTRSCLLIDLDLKRDSLAAVFEIDSSSIDTSLKLSPVPTIVENLSIWPARFFSLIRQMNLKTLIQSATQTYDYILLYAPYLPALADRKQIAVLSRQVILFSNNNKQNPLCDLLESCKTKIIYDRLS